jgi:hypothetical protein
MAIMTIPKPILKATDNSGDKFGVIILTDEKNYATQMTYYEKARVTEDNEVTIVDISDVKVLPQTNKEFYISSKEPLESYIGCNAELYEEYNGYWTYKITPITSVMRFDNV